MVDDEACQPDPVMQPLEQFWSAFFQQGGGRVDSLLQPLPGVMAETWRRKWLEALSESMEASMRRPPALEAMKQHIDRLITVERTKTPREVVYEEGTLRLLRYRDEQTIAYKEPVLICFALVNRPYILDLQPDRSVVRQLLRRGFDVYLIDWGTPAQSDCGLRLRDYVCGLMQGVTDFVKGHCGSRQVNLLGYCMGGTMSAMYTALYPQQVRNLLLMAAPIDFGGQRGLLNVWANERYFDVDGLIDTFGNCPGWFLQWCFELMKPVQNFHEKQMTLLTRLNDEDFLQNYLAMQRWTNDNIPVAGETFREFVKLLYRQNLLVKGQLQLNQHVVDLAQITCPLLMLTADFDHLVHPDSTLALEQQVASKEVTHLSVDAGHIGLAVSSRAHRSLWPDATTWLAEHSSPL